MQILPFENLLVKCSLWYQWLLSVVLTVGNSWWMCSRVCASSLLRFLFKKLLLEVQPSTVIAARVHIVLGGCYSWSAYTVHVITSRGTYSGERVAVLCGCCSWTRVDMWLLLVVHIRGARPSSTLCWFVYAKLSAIADCGNYQELMNLWTYELQNVVVVVILYLLHRRLTLTSTERRYLDLSKFISFV